MKAQPKASHYINGSFVDDERGKPIPVIYPATGETIAMVHSATENVVELAVEAAREAQPAWARLKPVERGRILRRAADILRARNDELARLETLDTGKAIQETLVADPASAADALEYFGSAIASYNGDYVDFGGSFAYTRREALGVCVGIGAWNYPIQGAGWKSAPALAMGNAMVFKPSENTPLSALALAEIYTEAGLPAGLFNVVQGYGDVGHALASHPVVAKVSLTGSVPTGRKVLGARRLADEARDDGARRQVAAHRLRRRRHRERGRRRHARQFLLDRPGLLQRHARLRPGGPARPLPRPPDRTHQGDPHRRPARSRNPDGAAHQQGAAREGPVLHRDRQERGRHACPWRRRAVTAGFRGRLLRRADDLQPTSPTACALRRRRFSGRSCRC